jgi:iron complex outermembrane receptor protein
MNSNFEFISIIKKRTLSLTFILGAASLAFAQQKVNLSGEVTSNQSAKIPYASITFTNNDNKINSDASLTDDNGQYKISLAPGNYTVSVEAIDFKTTKSTFVVTSASAVKNFVLTSGTSTATKTQDIQGVVITATNKALKVEIDKKVYDVKQDITSIGGNLQDVLQNVPSVTVDPDGTVSMRGSSNVKFLVNGKPSALLGIDNGADALQAIPADQIDRIEVITNPSAKYDASGTAGILNIILKKTTKVGFNGSVVGSLGYLPKTNLNTNLNWRKGKLTVFLNGGGGYRESKFTSRNDAYFTNNIGGNLKDSHQSGVTKSKNDNYDATTGFLYDITDNTSINASGTVRTYSSDTDGPQNYAYDYFGKKPDNQPVTSQRNSVGRSTNLAFQGDLGFDHKFDDKGQSISLSGSLQRNRSNSASDIQQFNDYGFGYGPFLTNENTTKNYTLNRSFVGKADYELPIGDASTFDAGYKIDDNNNSYDFHTTQNGLVLQDYTNVTKYSEIINAAYVQFKSKVGDFGYQLGLRDENSDIKINYYDPIGKTQIENVKSYNNLFPSVFLSYNIAENNEFLLNYSRRIDRPRSFFLIPFFSYNDNQNVFRGNPNLNPSYVDSFELGYNISKSKFSLNPTLYYRKQTDDVKITVVQDTSAVNTFLTTPQNLGTDERYGLDLNWTYDPAKWVKFLGEIDVFGYKTTGIYNYSLVLNGVSTPQTPVNYAGNGISTRLRLSTTFKFDKTASLQLQGQYRGAQIEGANHQDASYGVNLGATKTIWKGDGTIGFNISDIFNTRARRATSYGDGFTRDSYSQYQPRTFALSLTYRFKQGAKIEAPKKAKDINNNDSSDDQQGPM